MRKLFKIFIKYIYQYRFIVAVFLLFVSIFAGIFSLYNLETEAVIYAASLCFLAAIIIIGINFIHYYNKHKKLEIIKSNVELLTDKIPKASNLIESDYQNIVNELQSLRISEGTKYNIERSESIDYYTTWMHQIKVPIAVMRLVLQGEDTKNNKELLAELFRVEQYAEMALSYLRLDSSSSDLLIKEYDLDKIIRQAIRKYASQFIRRKIKIIYDGTTENIITDEKWLSLILEQYISNAIKYTNEGTVTIFVDENKILSISDTGIGIAKEDIPRIFEKGFTGYNGRLNKKSTGLGLYLCKKAADKMSYKIWVESKIGIGSVFYIDLNKEKLDFE